MFKLEFCLCYLGVSIIGPGGFMNTSKLHNTKTIVVKLDYLFIYYYYKFYSTVFFSKILVQVFTIF